MTTTPLWTPPREAFTTKPSAALLCKACHTPLDHTLAAYGYHVLCKAPDSQRYGVSSAGVTWPFPVEADAPAVQAPPMFARVSTDHPLKAELLEIIRWAASNDPRSLQTKLGPSDLGVDCMRRLAYGLAETPKANTTADPWFAIIGKATHEWLAIAMDWWQAEAHGKRPYADRRYLVEERVRVTSDQYDVAGSCDLYDRDRATIIDWKIVGASALKKYVANGPSNQYQKQVHIYGAGHEAAGRPVREVALAFLPRSGFLKDAYVWAAPYDRQVAMDALARAASVQELAKVLPYDMLPSAPDTVGCTWCPFWRPGKPADATGCPGVTG